jgi:LysR family transcriptional regulator, nitrogen assimilation regulatory protein
MTHAADMLHMSQPSLGLQIKSLEVEMGVELLERHSRGVSPTRVGKIMYERSISILQQVDALRDELNGADTTKVRSIALGLPPSIMRMLGEDIFTDAEAYVHNFTIEFTEERSFVLLDILDRNEIDLAFCYNTKEDLRYIRTPILEEELIFVAVPTSFRSEEHVTASEVLKRRLAISGARGIIHGLIQDQADRLNQTLEPDLSIHSVEMLMKIVKRGRAATVLPYGLVSDAVAAGTLAYRRIKDRPLYRTLYSVRMRGNRNTESVGLDNFTTQLAQRLQTKLGELARSLV